MYIELRILLLTVSSLIMWWHSPCCST